MRAILKSCACSVAACLLVAAPVVAADPPARLESSGSLGGATLDRARLQPAKLQPAVMRPEVTRLSSQLVKGGLSPAQVRGAASSLPPSQLGELFFGVARELESLEGQVTHTAVGYYMAALTDPDGRCYRDAIRRLRTILLDDALDHPQAARLYDGGLAILRNLCQTTPGMPAAGIECGMASLGEIKAAYQALRKQDSAGHEHSR